MPTLYLPLVTRIPFRFVRFDGIEIRKLKISAAAHTHTRAHRGLPFRLFTSDFAADASR